MKRTYTHKSCFLAPDQHLWSGRRKLWFVCICKQMLYLLRSSKVLNSLSTLYLIYKCLHTDNLSHHSSYKTFTHHILPLHNVTIIGTKIYHILYILYHAYYTYSQTSTQITWTIQCGKPPLANSPKASGHFGWRVTSTLYSLVWRITVVRRVGTWKRSPW